MDKIISTDSVTKLTNLNSTYQSLLNFIVGRRDCWRADYTGSKGYIRSGSSNAQGLCWSRRYSLGSPQDHRN